jgi:hypothetical protein
MKWLADYSVGSNEFWTDANPYCAKSVPLCDI